jgi:type IV pilus assembly protein PilW
MSAATLRCRLPRAARSDGFSLIELMIAVTLGILLGIGLVTLFGATSKTNRVQELMAELQENGRYAVTRLNNDLRLAARQGLNMVGYTNGTPGANGMVNVTLAPNVYVASIPFPDGAVGPPAGWAAANPGYSRWPLSQAYLVRGYACTSTSCTPNSVPAYLPAMGTGANARVPGADVLTVRYLNSQGWSSLNGTAFAEVAFLCNAGMLTNVTLTPLIGAPYNSPPANFVNNDLALLTSSSGDLSIFQVTVAAAGGGVTLTPTAVPNGGAVVCPGSGEVKLFNFSRDFITVTYWLRLDPDPNVPGRVIPALIRTQADNTGPPGANATHTDSELVQGVERLNFLYQFQKNDGSIEYLTADNVAAQSTAANCPLPPAQYSDVIPGTYETDTSGVNICLWRALMSIEAHLLVDSINNLFSLSAPEMAYQYYGSGMVSPPGPTVAMPVTGIPAGSMIRREFIATASIRNYNP